MTPCIRFVGTRTVELFSVMLIAVTAIVVSRDGPAQQQPESIRALLEDRAHAREENEIPPVLGPEAEVVAASPSGAVLALKDILLDQDETPRLRGEAAQFLGEVVSTYPSLDDDIRGSALDALYVTCESKSISLRGSAIGGLLWVWRSHLPAPTDLDPRVLPAVRSLLSSKNDKHAFFAIVAMLWANMDPPEFREEAPRLASRAMPSLRVLVAGALPGRPFPMRDRVLENLVGDEDADVRAAALRTLEVIGWNRSLPALQSAAWKLLEDRGEGSEGKLLAARALSALRLNPDDARELARWIKAHPLLFEARAYDRVVILGRLGLSDFDLPSQDYAMHELRRALGSQLERHPAAVALARIAVARRDRDMLASVAESVRGRIQFVLLLNPESLDLIDDADPAALCLELEEWTDVKIDADLREEAARVAAALEVYPGLAVREWVQSVKDGPSTRPK